MKGAIYIAGAFRTVIKSKCGCRVDSPDNDPHFWSTPPTWGICRPDLRERLDSGDYIFFVLPRKSDLPQSIFGYLKIDSVITHAEAYAHAGLTSKRMGNKSPNGNIIVDKCGRYNRYDGNVHKSNFDRIEKRFAVSNADDWVFLNENAIRRSAESFMPMLRRILDSDGKMPIDLISRYGKTLGEGQVKALKEWVQSFTPSRGTRRCGRP